MNNDTAIEVRNDVDALLALASQMHYLAATSDLSEVCVQSYREHKTVYDGTSVALEALLALKWPGVNVEWLRDLWIDLLEVPRQSDVEAMVLNQLYREHDPSGKACDWADGVVRSQYGDAVFNSSENGPWTKEVDAVWQAAHDAEYAAITRELEALARDMSTPRSK